MKFYLNSAEVFIPDGTPETDALHRTTHLAVSAHQDDIEIMAAGPIIECFHHPEKWFTGVVVTDGRGSPRTDLYASYDDEQMHDVRKIEQKRAAAVGAYSAQVLLDYPSKVIKASADPHPVEDLARLFQAAEPRFIYTHNLADKHDTHVATALRVLAALRQLPAQLQPEKVYGCEVWRDLDWMVDGDKVAFDLSSHENLQAALLGVFDSQICGGKRYDLAALGRRKANATFAESHGVDVVTGQSYAMDLTPLMKNPTIDPLEYVQEFIQRFSQEISDRIHRFC